MAKQLLEMWSVYESVGSQNMLGQVRVWLDPEANAGSGEITYADSTPPGTDVSIGRTLYQGDGEYPSPPNPFHSSAGTRIVAYQEMSPPYASIESFPIVCDLSDLKVTTKAATNGNNGQISISVKGTNGIKEYSINNGVNWSTNPVFQNLAPGSYTVVAADAKRTCTLTEEDVVVQNQQIAVNDIKITTVTVTHQQPAPADEDSGAIYVAASGTNKPFTFTIIHPSGATFSQSGISNTTFIDLLPGVYAIQVTDTKGNTITRNNVIVLADLTDEPTDPLDPTDVFQPIEIEVVEPTCENPFCIMWYDRLGGEQYWVFEKKQEYSIETEYDEEYEYAYSDLSELLNNRAYAQITGRKLVKVGANNLTKNRAEVLASIPQAGEAYLMEQDQDGEWFVRLALTPVPGNTKAYESDLTFNTVELTFLYPEDYL